MANQKRYGPWRALDIDPTDDKRAIRKAYAVKLKTTRPDEDPAAFQALVEARDAALFEAQWHSELVPDDAEVRSESAQAEPLQHSDEPDEGTPTEIEQNGREPVLPVRPDAVQGQPLNDVSDFDHLPDPTPPFGLSIEQKAALDRLFYDEGDDALSPSVWETALGVLEQGQLGLLAATEAEVIRALFRFMEKSPSAFHQSLKEQQAAIIHRCAELYDYWQEGAAAYRTLPEVQAHHFYVLLAPYVEQAAVSSDQARTQFWPNGIAVLHKQDRKIVFDELHGSHADFYAKTQNARGFPVSFSLLALLFPVPWLAGHQMLPAALFVGAFQLCSAGWRWISEELPILAPIPVPIFALILSIIIGFQARKMKYEQISRAVKAADDAAIYNLAERKRFLISRIEFNETYMIAGIVLYICVAALRLYSRTL